MLLLGLTAPAYGAEPDYGFGMRASVNWRLQLSAAEVHSIRAGSAAARQGMADGDQIVAIDDCGIPGCGARRAEKLLNTVDGKARHFRLRRADGSEYSVWLSPEPTAAGTAEASPAQPAPR
jgi:C-terminal processing protease CtpA/Prc